MARLWHYEIRRATHGGIMMRFSILFKYSILTYGNRGGVTWGINPETCALDNARSEVRSHDQAAARPTCKPVKPTWSTLFVKQEDWR
jgi:hypothetical protein